MERHDRAGRREGLLYGGVVKNPWPLRRIPLARPGPRWQRQHLVAFPGLPLPLFRRAGAREGNVCVLEGGEKKKGASLEHRKRWFQLGYGE